MNKKYYSAEEIAEMLQMHVKTVQRYIREGKIKAVKIGKAWRVGEEDLKLFINTFTNVDENNSIDSKISTGIKKITISSVIDIIIDSMDEAMRIANGITASMNNKPSEYGKSSLNVQFIEAENKLRLMLWGNAELTKAVLEQLSEYSSNP